MMKSRWLLNGIVHYKHVSGQVSFLGRPVLAHVTFKWFLPGVCTRVFQEAKPTGEQLRAHWTPEVTDGTQRNRRLAFTCK
ncbi:hypothetical protein DPMN_091105 [Dreissena polymorpha]|uniref:Uncharacterized protein n=1 Tax=Dreissena polymorpha TaxID=45954 RepID=A0A9D4KZF9_DREPO|nr:hypothetical protein DPMN_091105 [Dreissena polymorpha]